MKIFFVTLFLLTGIAAQADQWIQVTSMPVARASHSTFTIGNESYSGCGAYNMILKKDFWKFNSVSETWTQVADLPATERCEAFSFTINGIGYVGGGQALTAILKDFWAYDPVLNSWSQKADFPDYRTNAVAFTLGDSGYVATGVSPDASRELWAYDPSINSWSRKADLPGPSRSDAVGFGIDGKGYVGTGVDSSDIFLDDFYEYDPVSNSGSVKSPFGGGMIFNASAFAVSHAGYVILADGFLPQTWMYTPITDTWAQKAALPTTSRWDYACFEIGNFGYVCGGDTLTVNDGYIPGVCCWKYIPDTLDAIDEIDYFKNFTVIYSADEQQIEIRSGYRIPVTVFSDEGKLIANAIAVRGKSKIDVTNWSSGIYYLRGEMNQQVVVRKIIKY